jgi:hypothetical protein
LGGELVQLHEEEAEDGVRRAKVESGLACELHADQVKREGTEEECGTAHRQEAVSIPPNRVHARVGAHG